MASTKPLDLRRSTTPVNLLLPSKKNWRRKMSKGEGKKENIFRKKKRKIEKSAHDQAKMQKIARKDNTVLLLHSSGTTKQ